MGYKIREIEKERKFSHELTLDALGLAIRCETIGRVLQESGRQTQRERKLNLVVTVLLVIALHLYARLAAGRVISKVAQGLRYIWPNTGYVLPGASAPSDRRDQVGVPECVKGFWTLWARV